MLIIFLHDHICPSNRNWDQFEANKTLFGVESTFDEELYTTKLVRGPQLREREREAQRIAREIVGQQTRNVHLAEVLFLWKCAAIFNILGDHYHCSSMFISMVS